MEVSIEWTFRSCAELRDDGAWPLNLAQEGGPDMISPL